jgi:hypothetical protein
MAHFAVTDASGGTFTALERFSRGAQGLAGAAVDSGGGFRVWLEDWSAATEGDPGADIFPLRPIIYCCFLSFHNISNQFYSIFSLSVKALLASVSICLEERASVHRVVQLLPTGFGPGTVV